MDEPEKTTKELLEALKAHNIDPDEATRFIERLAAKGEDFIELPEVGSLVAIVARLDKLQETVDGIAAKLDSESSA